MSNQLTEARARIDAAGVTDISFPGAACRIPAWLNLDAIVPPEARDKLVDLIIEGTKLEATICDFAQRVHAARPDFEPDDDRPARDLSRSWRSVEEVYEMVQYLSGGAAVYELVSDMIGHLETAVDEGGAFSIGSTPDWAKSEPVAEEVAVWAKRAAQLALAGIPGDWPAFSTDSLRMAKDMLPVVATEQRGRGLKVDQDQAAVVLDDAIAGQTQ